MIKFLDWLLPARHVSPKEEMRRTANVIADAVQAAKDTQIEEAARELAAARKVHQAKRIETNHAIRAARDVRRAIRHAGASLDGSVQQVARRLSGGD